MRGSGLKANAGSKVGVLYVGKLQASDKHLDAFQDSKPKDKGRRRYRMSSWRARTSTSRFHSSPNKATRCVSWKTKAAALPPPRPGSPPTMIRRKQKNQMTKEACGTVPELATKAKMTIRRKRHDVCQQQQNSS